MEPQAGSPAPGAVECLRRRTAFALLVLLAAAPLLTLAGVVDPYDLNRVGRYLAFAIAAIGVDLIWGYAGVLSLCQAVFFGVGGYAVAMHLSLPAGGGDVRTEYNNLPQFFFFNGVETLPVWWEPFASAPVALGVALLLPSAVAGFLAFVIFRNRVRGVYFSIVTQALAWGAFLALSRNELLLGGTNGLTNFYKPLTSDTRWIVGLYSLTACVLVASYLGARSLVGSRLGRILIAIRDRESRLRFMGYRPEVYKACAFAAAALLAAAAGALYVPQNGIVTPNVMRVEDSIWMAIWAALGGRGRLWGAVAGAILANFSYAMLTSDMPRAWPFIQGGLFLSIVLFPDGLSRLWDRLEAEVASGGRVGHALTAFAALMLWLVADKMQWLPAALSQKEILGIQTTYWIGLAAGSTVGWRSAAPSAVPLLALAGLVIGEAFGLLSSGTLVLKYVLLVSALAWYLARQRGVSGRVPAWLWRVRPAGSS